MKKGTLSAKKKLLKSLKKLKKLKAKAKDIQKKVALLDEIIH